LFTVVDVVDELPLAAFGSGVMLETEAVLTSGLEAPAPTVITIVISGAVVTASDDLVQVTVDVPEQVHPEPPDETKVVFAGSGSETETLEANEGPPFVTLRV
jgi:hypothetical protein